MSDLNPNPSQEPNFSNGGPNFTVSAPTPPNPRRHDAPPPPRRGSLSRIFAAILLVLLLVSIAGNLFLFLGIAAIANKEADSPSGRVVQETIRSGGRDKIAVMPASGTVDELMVERIRNYAEAAGADSSIKAVVLEVDSPGGGITASDEIHHTLKLLAAKKKLVVSMRAIAASGGYYISMPADKIYAQPTTITGSIGVIIPAFEVSELMKKIGVTPQMITSEEAKFKDKGSPFRKFTEEDIAYFRALANDAHEKFKKVVKDGRGPKIANIDKVAIGEVWPAQKARDLGLIDDIAYLDEVCDKTAAELGISSPTVVRLKDRRGFLGELLSGNSAPVSPKVTVEVDPKKAIMELSTPRIEYRWVP